MESVPVDVERRVLSDRRSAERRSGVERRVLADRRVQERRSGVDRRRMLLT